MLHKASIYYLIYIQFYVLTVRRGIIKLQRVVAEQSIGKLLIRFERDNFYAVITEILNCYELAKLLRVSCMALESDWSNLGSRRLSYQTIRGPLTNTFLQANACTLISLGFLWWFIMPCWSAVADQHYTEWHIKNLNRFSDSRTRCTSHRYIKMTVIRS